MIKSSRTLDYITPRIVLYSTLERQVGRQIAFHISTYFLEIQSVPTNYAALSCYCLNFRNEHSNLNGLSVSVRRSSRLIDRLFLIDKIYSNIQIKNNSPTHKQVSMKSTLLQEVRSQKVQDTAKDILEVNSLRRNRPKSVIIAFKNQRQNGVGSLTQVRQTI